MRARTREVAAVLARVRWLVLTDPYASAAVGTALVATGWFALGPATTQRPVVRTVEPLLAGLLAIGMWQVSRDPRLGPAAVRFWRILGLGLLLYTLGMLVDLVGVGLAELSAVRLGISGELVFYPLAGLVTLYALIRYPTLAQTRTERLTLALDVATVLFGTATFVWYLVASRRWHPGDGWQRLADGLVLPALALVAGFVVLRIMLTGAPVMNRFTVTCFVFGALAAAGGIVVGPGPDTVRGRVASTIHVLGLAVCVVGIAAQRRAGPEPVRPGGTVWRRPFTVLPYGAIAATATLLPVVLRDRLDYRGWVVVICVVALSAVVMVRQATSLSMNARLLRHNRELTGQLAHQAFTDELTGLANRARFVEQVERALGEGGATVLFVDLDDFKVVNDSLGHHAGDQLLRAVAGRLRGAVDDGYTLGRLGGDEFAVLVPGPVDGRGPQVADRIVAALDGPFRITGMQVRVTASVGIAMAGATTGTMELLRNADVAMYEAKGSDKGRWRRFEPAMLAALQGRHRLHAALVQAVERDEFVVFYQPIVNLVDGSVRGAEALVRWRRPDGLLVEPTQFIALAEETGLIAEIDKRVLARACSQMASWTGGTSGPLSLHVNVSPRDLHRCDLVQDVAAILAVSGLPPDRLTLEITETGLGNDAEAAVDRLGELAAMGIHLAIDDFGTGYSSLAYLRRMPVDVLKIDKTFVDELAAGEGAPLVQAVIALAQTLGMQTVAEGVAHPDQVRRLLDLGCRYGQGFHYAPPLPASDMAVLVRALDSQYQMAGG